MYTESQNWRSMILASARPRSAVSGSGGEGGGGGEGGEGGGGGPGEGGGEGGGERGEGGGLLGGGDAKLLAACALWMGPEQIFLFLIHTALAGGALAILWRFEAPVRFALARGGLDVQVAVTRELPYGLAIAVGALLAAARMAGIS